MKTFRLSALAAIGLAVLAAAPRPAAAYAPLCNGNVILEATMPGNTTNSGTAVMVQLRNTTGQSQEVDFALNGSRPGFRLSVSGVPLSPSGSFMGVIGWQNTTFNPVPNTGDLASLLRFTCQPG